MSIPLSDAALDQLFREARTFSHWLDRPVSRELIQAVAELAKMGPTSANSSPARLVFVVTAEGRSGSRPISIAAISARR